MKLCRLLVESGTLLLLVNMPLAVAQEASVHHTIVPLRKDGEVIQRVSGDPDQPGVPFVIRIWNPDNYIVPVHWHPEDENIVVIQGTWYLGHGDKFDRTSLQEMKVGDYAFVPKKMLHFAWSKGETIIQVHGIGPFKIIFSQPVKSITDPGSASLFKFKQGEKVLTIRGTGVIREAAIFEGVTQYGIELSDGTGYAALEQDIKHSQ